MVEGGCAAVLPISGVEMPADMFERHQINGLLLMHLVDLDLEELLELDSIGLRHRLLCWVEEKLTLRHDWRSSSTVSQSLRKG
jgi:hypothetical protein